MTKKKRTSLTVALNLRIDERTIHRLDALAIERSRPGAIVGRSDVAREALSLGLDVIEKRKGK